MYCEASYKLAKVPKQLRRHFHFRLRHTYSISRVDINKNVKWLDVIVILKYYYSLPSFPFFIFSNKIVANNLLSNQYRKFFIFYVRLGQVEPCGSRSWVATGTPKHGHVSRKFCIQVALILQCLAHAETRIKDNNCIALCSNLW